MSARFVVGVLATAIAVAFAVLVTVAVVSSRAHGAEPEHVGPRWQLWQQPPGQEWAPRGKPLRGPTACNLDLASVANVVDKATRLACRKVAP